MENGLFSTDEFTAWSQKYVMFLHVTTRLEGRKHDGLLKEKRFTGFPTMCAMDVSGKVTAKHAGRRDLEPFAETLAKGRVYEALAKQAAAGDKTAQLDLFVKDLELRSYSYAHGMLRYAAMRTDMPKRLRESAQQHLVDLQYAELSRSVRATLATDREGYLKRWNALRLDFFRSGSLPSGYQGSSILRTVMNHARTEENVKLFAAALTKFKECFGSEERNGSRIEMLEKQLEEMRAK
ncbi:MAG: hypothetical protein CMJ85_09735 [Planctomycetes bacterium]|nr:hypothetical protein [Planctomycetota bacterium]